VTDWWQIICPDGLVRHFPYVSQEAAEVDADCCSKLGCRMTPKMNPLEVAHPPCPRGVHTIRRLPAPEVA
jgi:hypothetical protein